MTRLLLLLAGQGGGAWLVQRLAADQFRSIALSTASAGDLVVVALHVAAALGLWWLVLGTVYDLVAALHARRRGALPGTGFAPRWVQRIIQQAVGSALVLTVMAGPAMAQTVAQPPAATAPADLPVAPPVVPDRPASPSPPAAPPGPTHTVAAGENLWVIARGVVTPAEGAAPSDRTVHEYWVRLIAANQESLQSGDPDLIFPGEVLVLPDTAAEA